ncbi:MAG: formyltransferase family protein [Chloroflexota bacterium]
MYRLGWFSTARGQGSQQLLRVVQETIASGEIEAGIVFVFCSREKGESLATDQFLGMVADYHLPLVSLSYRRFKERRHITATARPEALPDWRLDYDREVMARLDGFQPDLCVLAGYMLVVGRELCRRYPMINLHPAAPGGPRGTWQEVIWQLIEGGARETGVMMHLVVPELDAGPAVTYATFPVRGEPFDRYWREIAGRPVAEIRGREGEQNRLFQLIRRHGAARELPLVVATIRAFSQGWVKIAGGRVVNATGRLLPGYDLSGEIDRQVQAILADS